MRNGFGVVTFENVQLISEDGIPTNLFNNGRLDRSNPAITAWLAAWSQSADSINGEDIDSLIAVIPKEGKEEKAAKKIKTPKPQGPDSGVST